MFRYILLLCAVLITDGCTKDKSSQALSAQVEENKSEVFFQAKNTELGSKEKYASNEQDILAGDRCRCAPGATGPEGPQGPQGPPGSGGGGAFTQIIHHSMSLPLVPTYDFAFYPANGGGFLPTGAMSEGFTPVQFNPLSSNPNPPDYAYTFLVPATGEINDLLMRINFTANGSVAASFTFTVYKSNSFINTDTALTGWTSTGLSETTNIIEVGGGTSRTVTAEAFSEPAFVTAGDLLTVVVSSSGFTAGEIAPASLSVSYRYTEVATAK